MKFTPLFLVIISFVLYSKAFAQYGGGNDDGYSMNSYQQSDYIPVNSIFGGGVADGFDVETYVQSDYIPVNNIFGGGVADGFDMETYVQADYIPVNNIFGGGVADGFDMETYVQADYIPVNNIFGGGVADGFAIGYYGTPGTFVSLPIELLSFTAKPEGRNVLLEWQTATEINNDYFTIERSKDVQDWEYVTSIDGAGNSNIAINYSAYDYSPYSGTSYYRLKQTDFDGQFTYSAIRTVRFTINATMVIYPNPTAGLITIQASVSELETLIVYNALGQNVTNHVRITTINEGVKQLDLQELASGVYMVKTSTMVNRIIKND